MRCTSSLAAVLFQVGIWSPPEITINTAADSAHPARIATIAIKDPHKCFSHREWLDGLMKRVAPPQGNGFGFGTNTIFKLTAAATPVGTTATVDIDSSKSGAKSEPAVTDIRFNFWWLADLEAPKEKAMLHTPCMRKLETPDETLSKPLQVSLVVDKTAEVVLSKPGPVLSNDYLFRGSAGQTVTFNSDFPSSDPTVLATKQWWQVDAEDYRQTALPHYAYDVLKCTAEACAAKGLHLDARLHSLLQNNGQETKAWADLTTMNPLDRDLRKSVVLPELRRCVTHIVPAPRQRQYRTTEVASICAVPAPVDPKVAVVAPK
jgi:hypothetical protein